MQHFKPFLIQVLPIIIPPGTVGKRSMFCLEQEKNGIRWDCSDNFDCFVSEVVPCALKKYTWHDRRKETSVLYRSEIAVKFTSNVSVKTDPRSVIIYEKLAVPRHRTARSVAVTQMAATRPSVVVGVAVPHEARMNVESVHTTTGSASQL